MASHEIGGIACVPVSPEQYKGGNFWAQNGSRNRMTPVGARVMFTALDENGDAIAPQICVSCNGVIGISEMSGVAHLAGDFAVHLKAQLEAFRDGSRASDIMNGTAADQTDEEIAAAFDWYSGITLGAK